MESMILFAYCIDEKYYCITVCSEINMLISDVEPGGYFYNNKQTRMKQKHQ